MRLLINHWDIRFVPDAHVFEEAVPTLKGLLRQRRRWAEGSIRRYLDYIFPLNSPTRLSFVERGRHSGFHRLLHRAGFVLDRTFV